MAVSSKHDGYNTLQCCLTRAICQSSQLCSSFRVRSSPYHQIVITYKYTVELLLGAYSYPISDIIGLCRTKLRTADMSLGQKVMIM